MRSRRIFCEIVGKMGYPDTEVARYLGITNSSVDRLPVSDEIQDLKKDLTMF